MTFKLLLISVQHFFCYFLFFVFCYLFCHLIFVKQGNLDPCIIKQSNLLFRTKFFVIYIWFILSTSIKYSSLPNWTDNVACSFCQTVTASLVRHTAKASGPIRSVSTRTQTLEENYLHIVFLGTDMVCAGQWYVLLEFCLEIPWKYNQLSSLHTPCRGSAS